MPWKGPRRPLVNFRMTEAGIAHVDRMALDAGLVKGDGTPNRSEALRLFIQFATDRMTVRDLRRAASGQGSDTVAGRTGRPRKTTTTNGDQP